MTSPAAVTLTLVKGRLEPGEYVFDERTTCVLGRSADCAPRVPDDAHHKTVSRHHCLLDINPPDIRIRDFGSLNGTYVNGEKIGQRRKGLTPEQAAAESYPEHDLADGDEIRLGETVLRIGIARQATLVLAQCAKCGREVGEEAGGRAGEILCAACQAEPAAVLNLLLDLAQGGRPDLDSIRGYVVLRELGRGGMGAVYLARHESTGAEVALKVMLPKVAASATARARFLREVALTRALKHRHVASLHDAGFANGTFYLTTEFCIRGSLDRLLEKRGGRLPAGEAVRIAVQALKGLEHAHEQGVVHRDLSPSNILLHEEGDGSLTAKIADFGIGKAFDQAGLSGLTRTGATAGKPTFMPRQQVINFRKAAPAVDVWALAACLYHMLTGALPREFPRGKDPWHVVLQEPAIPIRRRDSGIPGELAEVIDRALVERPEIGFQSAGELRRALERAGR
ncbi:protein kinase [Streptomyces sp. A7024]|uniref:non-specific serine/threonine protein kinase n=1 Tax=Streptomyces coryli TaxID=1128680 RepID=A0A6G4TUG3_9ACTN|nr:protein kinase [Streptomyces coryli]NGN62667.1 protein kinase [Streptomyces coryli]